MVVDSGATWSMAPATECDRRKPVRTDLFKTASGSAVNTYDYRELEFDIGLGRVFKHKFFMADVENVLLGFDFLAEHQIYVDCAGNTLIDTSQFHQLRGSACNVAAVLSVDELQNPFSQLLREYPDLIAPLEPAAQMPPVKHNYVHSLTLKPNARLFKSPPRRLFGAKYDIAESEVNKLLQLGILRPSSSELASPLQVVSKHDGSWRPCGDFRMLNAITENDCYPLSHVEDFCLSLRGATIFSKIDLVRAFHQIPLDEKSIPLTAIATPFGLYEFTRMPFGLKNAAQSFQRFMDEVLRGLKGIYCYVDDILVASANAEEHTAHLVALFARLRAYGLLINKTKTIMGKPSVEFLGFCLSKEGARTLDTQVEAMRSFPEPKTVQSLQEFLGLANFYRRFTPRFAHIAYPLYGLLKPLSNCRPGVRRSAHQPLTWTPSARAAFVALKDVLARQVTLAFPDPKLCTRLVTDASDNAVGAVLEQNTDQGWRPIGFFSRKLDPREQRYSTYDRELLAIHLAVKKFEHLIVGISGNLFHIRTDHKPLTLPLPPDLLPTCPKIRKPLGCFST